MKQIGETILRVLVVAQGLSAFSFFPLKSGPLGSSGGTVHDYRTSLVGYTVKTTHDTTDIQSVESDYSKTIRQEIQEEHKTKEGRDERVEKHSCQIELRGEHLKLVDYNGKQVLLCIHHVTCHYSPACEE